MKKTRCFLPTGVLEPSEFRQFLNGPPLEIELHDRDRKQSSMKVKPTLFGDDLEDEKINNVGTVTSEWEQCFMSFIAGVMSSLTF